MNRKAILLVALVLLLPLITATAQIKSIKVFAGTEEKNAVSWEKFSKIEVEITETGGAGTLEIRSIENNELLSNSITTPGRVWTVTKDSLFQDRAPLQEGNYRIIATINSTQEKRALVFSIIEQNEFLVPETDPLLAIGIGVVLAAILLRSKRRTED